MTRVETVGSTWFLDAAAGIFYRVSTIGRSRRASAPPDDAKPQRMDGWAIEHGAVHQRLIVTLDREHQLNIRSIVTDDDGIPLAPDKEGARA